MVSLHKVILLLVLEYISLGVFCESYNVQMDDCSYGNFKKELQNSCKFKRDGEPNGEGTRAAVPWSDHQEPYEFPKGFEDMDFYKEIMDNRPVHPSIHGPRAAHPQEFSNNNRLGAQYPEPVPVPYRPVERSRPPPQHQQQYQQGFQQQQQQNEQQQQYQQQYQQQQQQQQQRGPSYPPIPYDTYGIPEAFEEGGKTRKRMLRNAYMSLFAKCCGRNCKSEDFHRFCP